MDELNLEFNLDELEVINKLGASKFDFPVVYLNGHAIGFNAAATAFVPNFIKWFCNSEFIVGIPSNEYDTNSFKVHNTSKHAYDKGKATTFPTVMSREKKVKPGYAKLYKYKNGFAFKRYERIQEVN